LEFVEPLFFQGGAPEHIAGPILYRNIIVPITAFFLVATLWRLIAITRSKRAFSNSPASQYSLLAFLLSDAQTRVMLTLSLHSVFEMAASVDPFGSTQIFYAKLILCS